MTPLKQWGELLLDKFVNANLAWPLKALIAVFILMSLWYLCSHLAIFLMQRIIELTKHTLAIIRMLLVALGFLIGVVFLLMAVRYTIDSNRQCAYFLEEFFTRCRPLGVGALVPPVDKKAPLTDKNKSTVKPVDKASTKEKSPEPNKNPSADIPSDKKTHPSKSPERGKESGKIKGKETEPKP